MPATLLETAEPTHQDIRKAREAATALSEGTLEVSHLPDVARQLLARVLAELANGNAISVVPALSDLTTSQAARFLNVSRPYLSRLLDEGMLPFHRVGSHRRVHLRDVRVYRARQDAASEAALCELAAQAQELGMGY